MTIRMPLAVFVVVSVLSTEAWSQQAGVADDIQQGHRWANVICAICHVATPDQGIEPVLHPAGPSFESIAQRPGITAEWIRTFLATTHHDAGNAKGMPNPMLLDFQMEQVAAYIMSLRKTANPALPAAGH
jgi:mono/diheme cytochrome c family protein